VKKKEPLSNIQMLCPEHSPKPIDYDGDPVALVGRHVKLKFDTGPAPDDIPAERWPDKESMWVKVSRVDGSTLIGFLDNEPVAVDMEVGDEVKFTVAEIVDIFAEGSA